ncbi:outer membrane protein [Polynucleobacter sp. UK-Kesae-W10]|uniref:outer membrane protein n=1 Tax=Polynucleobacter sp. UK-Kesae-W10 TaxID=1819738 RepID=UPI001C0B7FCF|nr:outer membrane beta-barrel protein [Polynucleobacter sp. UK-Kesae-W10]MBU3576916.1 outer membrane beta-barrel protein [Polynucleobacter sp. UK-Kesae-W10]
MKKKLLVAVATAVVASSAMAQSAFEGAYAQIATGYENNTLTSLGGPYSGVDISNNKFSGNISGGDQTASGVPLVLGLGYTFQVTGPWTVGLGADYSALSQKTNTYTLNNSNGVPLAGNQGQISNRFNVYVTPGFAIDKDKLVYVKAGYSTQQLKMTTNASGTDPSLSNTSTMNGYIAGIGYKQIITGGIYGFVEGNYMSYSHTGYTNSWTSTNGNYKNSYNGNPAASAYNLLVGVGYKF